MGLFKIYNQVNNAGRFFLMEMVPTVSLTGVEMLVTCENRALQSLSSQLQWSAEDLELSKSHDLEF